MSDLANLLETGDKFVSAPAAQRVRPAYKVEKLPGKRSVTKFVRNEKTGVITKREVEEDAGYLYTNMRGDSIRVKDIDGLRRIGVTALRPLVDSDTGDVVGSVDL